MTAKRVAAFSVCLLFLGTAGAGAQAAAAKKSGATMSAAAAKPTIVLVHGAFADASSFQYLIPLLLNDGYNERPQVEIAVAQVDGHGAGLPDESVGEETRADVEPREPADLSDCQRAAARLNVGRGRDFAPCRALAADRLGVPKCFTT